MTSVGDKLTLDREELWQAVLQRDTAFDEAFVYAVRSTGIYCRPSCSSRKPKRRHVDFFRLPELAKQSALDLGGSARKVALLRQESGTVDASDEDNR